MNITLFGGAFDPPHLGHQRVAQALIEKKLADQVWYVPVHEHPWAKRLGKDFMSQYSQRLAMIQLLVQEPTIQVQEFKGVSYTYDTLEYFKNTYAEHHFSWVMGSEYLPKFDDFLSVHPKLTGYTFFIFPRSGFSMSPLLPNMQPIIHVKEIDISSTLVRQTVKAGQSFDSLVTPKVKTYILTNKLYL